MNPGLAHISYDITDLYTFMDGMSEIVVLSLDPASKQFDGVGTPSLKEAILQYLQQQA